MVFLCFSYLFQLLFLVFNVNSLFDGRESPHQMNADAARASARTVIILLEKCFEVLFSKKYENWMGI